MRLAGHSLRHPDLTASKLILWEPSYRKRTRGRPHSTFLDSLKRDTGPSSASEIRTLMEDRDEWHAAIRDSPVGVGYFPASWNDQCFTSNGSVILKSRRMSLPCEIFLWHHWCTSACVPYIPLSPMLPWWEDWVQRAAKHMWWCLNQWTIQGSLASGTT